MVKSAAMSSRRFLSALTTSPEWVAASSGLNVHASSRRLFFSAFAEVLRWKPPDSDSDDSDLDETTVGDDGTSSSEEVSPGIVARRTSEVPGERKHRGREVDYRRGEWIPFPFQHYLFC
jgi:hypothetical protein